MKKYKKITITTLALMVLILMASSLSYAEDVGIADISLESETNVSELKDSVTRALKSKNLNVVDLEKADYELNVYQTGLEKNRQFNWVVLFVPAWPVIGITKSTTTVYVESSITDENGETIYTGSGKNSKTTMLFSDFRHPSAGSLLSKAAERSVAGAGVIASGNEEEKLIEIASISF